jgi:hypothetical protein
MPPLPHRVRRLSFHVRATSSGEALALRAALHRQIDTVTAAMARALDAVGAGDAIVHLPRLELRARIASVDEVGDALAQRIEHALRRELSALRTGTSLDAPVVVVAEIGGAADRRARSSPLATLHDGGDREDHDRVAERLRGAPHRAAGGELAEPGHPRELLVHYLETGALPWPLANLSTTAALSALREVARADLLRVVDQLTRQPGSLRAQVALWFRSLQLVPDEEWPHVARAASRSSDEPGARLTEIVAALAGEPAGWLSRHARLQLAAAAIVRTRQTTAAADPAELAAVVHGALTGAIAGRAGGDASHGNDAAVDSPSAGARIRTSQSATGTNMSVAAAADPVRAAAALAARLPEPAATAFRDWLAPADRHVAGAAQPAAVPPAAAQVAAAPGTTAAGARSSAARHPELPSSEPRGADLAPSPAPLRAAWPGAEAAAVASRAERTEHALDVASRAERTEHALDVIRHALPFGEIVHHAGLLLLHPYLPRFFDSTRVKQAGAPALLATELPRAAALLHLIATGDPEPFELELDFIKLLLGAPRDAQLPISEGLVRPADRDEVDALLGAVIAHWSALGRTSVQGLRVSFLQRHGLLREQDQGFRLQVEPAPFDMLLGQLPWGIATVKLPWMTKVIFTDWPAP